MSSERELRLRYADVLRGNDDPHLLRLIGDLHHVSTAGVVPEGLPANVERAYRERRAEARHSPGRRTPFRLPARLALAMSIALVAFGILLTPRALPPSPVSAQVILHRAAFTHLPPHEALHLVYRSWGGGETGSEDIWQVWNRHGVLARSSVWERDQTAGTVTLAMHTVQSGDRVREFRYLPASLVVFVSSYAATRPAPGPLGRANLSTGAGVAQVLTNLAHHPRADARLLPDRTLAGVFVHVVRVRFGQGNPATTLYIDAQSYVLRGVDGGRLPGLLVPSVRLVKDQIVPLSAVPRGVFRLTTGGLMPVPEP